MLRLMPSVCLALLALTVSLGASHAQLLNPTLTVSGRIYSETNSCENAPDKCTGDAWIPQTGVCEFDFYSTWQDIDSDSSRFVLGWPEEWTVISWETCDAEIVSGDASVPGSTLLFAYDDCRSWYDRPFFRLIVDCPAPGRFGIEPWPESHECGGGWSPGIFIYDHVEVGDYCGAIVYGPCGACPLEIAGRFDPPSLSLALPPAGSRTDAVEVSGGWSGGPEADCPCWPEPECGGEQMAPCSGDVHESLSWVSMELISSNDDVRLYNVTVDAGELPPGVYEGRIHLDEGCSCCEATCLPLTLTVLEPSSTPRPSVRPLGLSLEPIYPSPFQRKARISFHLPSSGPVTVLVYDVVGSRIRKLAEGPLAAGYHELIWSGVNDSGVEVPSGIYFVAVETDRQRAVQRLIFLR